MNVCLCLIVKNESKTLPRLIESVRHLIDSYCICDTGSTDDTIDTILRQMGDIPGEIHRCEWVNFGHNRTVLMEYAYNKADWLLLADADFEIIGRLPADDEMSNLSHISGNLDGFLLKHTGNVEHWQALLVNGHRRWKYVGVTHEYITPADDAPVHYERWPALMIAHRGDGGMRSEKFTRDLALLEQAHKDEPNNPRTAFYLANTLRDIADETTEYVTPGGSLADLYRADAVEMYELRAEMGGWHEEVYVSLFEAGKLRERRGDWAMAMNTYIRAWEYRPQRLEALHALVQGLRLRRHYHTAYALSLIAVERAQPADDVLFMATWVWKWGLLFEHSIACYYVDKHVDALLACESLLKVRDLPEDTRQRVLANRKFSVDKLHPSATQEEG
jgi:tetratricopeptide (TPR) repeat protein